MFTVVTGKGTSQPEVRSLRPDGGPVAQLCGRHLGVYYTVGTSPLINVISKIQIDLKNSVVCLFFLLCFFPF